MEWRIDIESKYQVTIESFENTSMDSIETIKIKG